MLQQALKSYPNCNKSHNLVTLVNERVYQNKTREILVLVLGCDIRQKWQKNCRPWPTKNYYSCGAFLFLLGW